WLAQGPLSDDQALLPGRYPAQNATTTYSGEWQFGELGADVVIPEGTSTSAESENRITVHFDGSAFAIPVRRDDYLAYLYVMVDGKPANALPRNREDEAFIILTSPERQPTLDLILVAKGLREGEHIAEIIHRPSNGDARWPIAGFAVGAAPDTDRYDRALMVCAVVGGLALLAALILSLRLPWNKLAAPSLPTFRHFLEWLLSLFASFVVLLGLLMTWGETVPSLLRRDQPALAITIVTAGIASLSPAFVITLAALGVLFVLIYNRPLLGLMLIIFWSAFFLSTLDLLFNAFAAVEVYFGLTAAAVIARGCVAWAKQHQHKTQTVPRLSLTRLDILVLAFAALGIISLSWAEFWSPAIRELRVVILEPAAFYFLIRMMRLERRDIVWLADTLLFTGAMIALVGLVLYFTGESVVDAEEGPRRLISVYGSPNGVGLYLGRCLPFALGYLLLSRRGSWRWLYGVGCGAVMLFAVVLSQSRGAILLGIPAAIVVIVIIRYGRRGLLPAALTLAAIGIVLIPLTLVLPRLADLFGDTTFFRKSLWYSSVQLIRERPLTGVGLDQFLYWYRSRYLLPEAWEEPNLSVPHNMLLNHWVSLGLFGVLAGIAFQGMFWRMIWRVRTRLTESDPLLLALMLGLAGSMADLLAHGLVDVGYFAINLAFVFFLLLALLQRLEQLSGMLDQNQE
ncbi:MAG: O-antigen ligase family protein, partial [Chloroflexi bacterium]|nr:O-antigen ligase family protein [Chloroflexota bacterium]